MLNRELNSIVKNKKEKTGQIIPVNVQWLLVYFVLYILLGTSLGVMPFGQMMFDGLEYSFCGWSDMSELCNIFQLSNTKLFIPYGARLTEAFGAVYLLRLIGLTGISALGALQWEAFLFFSLGYIFMIKVMTAISNSRWLGMVLTMVYFWSPALVVQQGVPPLYFGVLFIPVMIWRLYNFQQYLNLKISVINKRDVAELPSRKKDICCLLSNFLCFLILGFTSWYLAVIAACAVCLYFLIYLSFHVKKNSFGQLVKNYFLYVLIPWFFVLGINLLMTPISVAKIKTDFDFINGSSIDLITMLLPSEAAMQFVSRFFSVEAFTPSNQYIPGNGVRFYFGYSILILTIVSIIVRKNRNKINISILITGFVLFVLSLGPGLRVAAFLDNEMINELGIYRLPLERDLIQFPWGFLFQKFPLTIMRAVYRWYIGALPFFIILAARVLRTLTYEESNRKKWVYAICILMCIEFVPNLKLVYDTKANYYNTYGQVYADCVEELEEVFGKEEKTLAFCSYDYNDNTYMVPLIMRELENCVSYSGAGDKSRDIARAYTPQCVLDFMHGTEPENLAKNVSEMSKLGLADYAILPFYSLSDAVYSWPMNDQIVERTKEIAEKTAENLKNKYQIYYLEHYMIIDLSSETIKDNFDILADKNTNNAKLFLLDDGFGTKYAIDVESEEYEYSVSSGDDSLYIYCVTKGKSDEASELFLEYRNEAGDVIGSDTYTKSGSKYYSLSEFHISLPYDTKSIKCSFKETDAGKTYLKKMYMASYNQKEILKTRKEIAVEESLGLVAEKVENIDIAGDILEFYENSNLEIKDAVYTSEVKRLNLKMDILIENEYDNVEIMNKWNSWGDDMTFGFSLHNDEGVYYFNLSPDGKNAKGISWSLEDMPTNQWNSLEVSFDDGTIKVMINERCVLEEQCEFQSLYASNRFLKIGNGMIGKLRNFKYEIN